MPLNNHRSKAFLPRLFEGAGEIPNVLADLLKLFPAQQFAFFDLRSRAEELELVTRWRLVIRMRKSQELQEMRA
jgi:hypothetical protein